MKEAGCPELGHTTLIYKMNVCNTALNKLERSKQTSRDNTVYLTLFSDFLYCYWLKNNKIPTLSFLNCPFYIPLIWIAIFKTFKVWEHPNGCLSLFYTWGYCEHWDHLRTVVHSLQCTNFFKQHPKPVDYSVKTVEIDYEDQENFMKILFFFLKNLVENYPKYYIFVDIRGMARLRPVRSNRQQQIGGRVSFLALKHATENCVASLRA